MNGMDLVKRYDELDGRKGTYKTHIQEVAEFINPAGANVVTHQTLGSKHSRQIYDSWGMKCLTTFASGMYGNVMSAAAQWFELQAKDKTVGRRNDVKRWLRDCTERMHDCLNESNNGMTAPQVFHNLGWAGTAPLYIGEGKKNVLALSAFSPARCAIMEDQDRMVDVVFRQERMSARRVVKKWPKTASDRIQRIAERTPAHEVDIIHAAYEREDQQWFFDRRIREMRRKVGALNMPYVSTYVERDGGNILEESGYEEFPYAVPRWEPRDEEEYGYSPGMRALADIKMLNKMSEEDIKAQQLIVRPPLVAPMEMALSTIRQTPGGITYSKPGAKPEPLYTPDKYRLALEYEEHRRQVIAAHFFHDFFAWLGADDPQRTAYEISKRAEQAQLHLGAALGRIQKEYLGRLLERTFWIMFRLGYMGQVPDALVGSGLSIQYTGRLAMAMRFGEVQAITQGLEIVGGMSTFAPEVVDVVETDKAAVGILRRLGVSEDFIASDERVLEKRQQRAEIQQQQQQVAALGEMVKAVPPGKAIEKGSMLDMMGGGAK
jgi:hypothetical protein